MNKEQIMEKLRENRDSLSGFRVKTLHLFGSNSPAGRLSRQDSTRVTAWDAEV